MHSLNTALFAAVAAAASSQSTITVLNPFDTASTLSALAFDASATTYVNVCNNVSFIASGSGTLAGPASISDKFSTTYSSAPLASAVTITDAFSAAIPSALATTTAQARLRRQDDGDEDTCESYTLIQGPSTWAYHLTDAAQGATTDAACSWKGASTTADLTCVASLNGTAITESGATTASVTTWKASDRSSTDYNTVSVTGSATSEASVASTTGPKSTGSSTGSATGSAAATHSTGLAAPMAIPTGAMAFVGGAAGLLAAAIAL